jgi:hypothetical protein
MARADTQALAFQFHDGTYSFRGRRGASIAAPLALSMSMLAPALAHKTRTGQATNFDHAGVVVDCRCGTVTSEIL